jgi:hypothetical protein
MPRFLSPEVKARVRELYEGTALTHARIAAVAKVGASTVSVLANKEGWTRHPGARTSPRLSNDQCEAILRLRQTGASTGDIAAAAGCHRDTVRRIAPPERPVAAACRPTAPAAASDPPLPAPVPDHLAELHAALTRPELRKAEAAPLLLRAAAALGAEALLRQDLAVERTGQVLARLAERVAALPDEGPHAGAGIERTDWRPATFEETNELLEDLARRLAAWDAAEDGTSAAATAGALDEAGAAR